MRTRVSRRRRRRSAVISMKWLTRARLAGAYSPLEKGSMLFAKEMSTGSEMGKDLFGTKEPAKERAARMWRNNELAQRFKKMKDTGEGAEQFPVRDGKKYFDASIPKPPKEALRPADLIENDRPKAQPFERKFIKDIREMMNEHRSIKVEHYLAAIREEKRKLLIEKLRRREASIAEREGAKT
jgi:hypothetical protein